MASLHDLHKIGQSTWLDHLRNSFIRSGELAEQLKLGVQGVTVNTRILERAITSSSEYDGDIRRAAGEGNPVQRIQEALMVDDVQRAADLLHSVFEATGQRDGFVSFELDMSLLHDTNAMLTEARRLLDLIDRDNVMVEIPATPDGIRAIRALTAAGISVNATHLFSPTAYDQVAMAYLEGLVVFNDSHSARRASPTAVASFSLAPIDAIVDARLNALGRGELRGKTALALAHVIYARNRQLFSGPEWDGLAPRQATPMRPKWTDTRPRDFRHSEFYYVNQLAVSDTILTFSPATLAAFRQDGVKAVEEWPGGGVDAAEAHLAEVRRLGIDLDALAHDRQQAHLAETQRRFQALAQAIKRKRDTLDDPRPLVARLGEAQADVDAGLAELCRHRVVCRIWNHDHTVWNPAPKEITNRLGWLHIAGVMADNVSRLKSFAQSVAADGLTHALLLGMGGSSLAPELFQKTMGGRSNDPAVPALELLVLDTTDADAVRTVEEAIDLRRTLVIVATKSGGTVETLSAFKYFYNKIAATVGLDNAGRQFIGITDPGSKIAAMAEQYGFRDLFINDPNIGGRYSALSYFGLAPAALVGVDIAELLERAAAAAANASLCHCDAIGDNQAARLGAILGRLALAGRDKVTFITSPALASFGDWAEQLIAESTGKEGQGILPVVGEPPAPVDTYGPDRLFVHLRLGSDTTHDAFVDSLAGAGHPLVALQLADIYDIGGQFFLWEMATAIASYFLAINPFDQPNVEAAKIKARNLVTEFTAKGELPTGDFAAPERDALSAFLEQAKPGDYVAIQAYIAATPAADAALQALRQAILLRTSLATTVGYGPRFLHSTGQLHKGDRGNGLFIQFVSEAEQNVAIPDEAGAPAATMSFNVLKKAQAIGDAGALRDAGRRVIAFQTGRDPVAVIKRMAAL